MAIIDDLLRVAKPLGDSIRISEGPVVTVRDIDELRADIEPVVRTAVFGDPRERGLARWLIRTIAVDVGQEAG